MVRHEGIRQKKPDISQKYHVTKHDSDSLFDQFREQKRGMSSFTETPFRPKINQHYNLLKTAPSNEVRANLILRLQESYGNTYVQRLLESVIQKRPVNANLIQQFSDKNPGHEGLFQGIQGEMADFSIINRLLNNFYKRDDFQYTGSRKAFWSHEGDCGTLVGEFQAIAAECFQIDLQLGQSNKPIFVPGPKNQIGDKRTGNVDSGQGWIYDEHYWIVFEGKPIDVLFGHWGVIYDEGKFDIGRYEYQFGDKVYYFNKKAKNLSDVYTSNPKNRAKNPDEIPQF